MSASEMIDKSTVVGANDDAPAGLCVVDGVNVAVISGRTAGLADVASLRPDGWRRKPVRRGSEPLRHMRLASKCHHGLQDVGCAEHCFAAWRALPDTLE